VDVVGPCVLLINGQVRFGPGCYIRSPRHNPVDLFVGHSGTLEVGSDTFINQGVRISCSHRISIGRDCLLGDESVILDNDFHALPGEDAPGCAPVVIGDHVWIATRVIVLRGVTIGESSVVAAGSVVTKDIPPFSLAAGVPARVVRELRDRPSGMRSGSPSSPATEMDA
jgi:acetyltransferase-like isoleucine patch superfamily enzyme